MSTDSLSTILRRNIIGCSKQLYSDIFSRRRSWYECSCRTAERAEAAAADEEIADANPTFQTRRCSNFWRFKPQQRPHPHRRKSTLEKLQHMHTAFVLCCGPLKTSRKSLSKVSDIFVNLNDVDVGRYGLWPYHKSYQKIQRNSKHWTMKEDRLWGASGMCSMSRRPEGNLRYNKLETYYCAQDTVNFVKCIIAKTQGNSKHFVPDHCLQLTTIYWVWSGRLH